MEKAFCRRHGEEGGDFAATTRLSADCDIGGVTAEEGDIVTHPFQSFDYILLSQINGLGILASESAQVQIAEDIQTVIDIDHHHISFQGEGTALITRQVMAGAAGIAAAVYPDEYRALLRVIDTGGPYVQHLAGFVHRLQVELVAEAIVGLGVAVVVKQSLGLGALGTVQFALSDAFPAVGSLRRHEALSLGVAYSLEGVYGAVEVTFDSTVDGVDPGVFTGGNRSVGKILLHMAGSAGT